MNPSLKVYIDGALCDEGEAKVSVFDHGLLYGDGVFEGIRFYCGRVFKLDEHIDRLYDSAKAIHLEIPLTKREMSNALLETIRANELEDGYVRLVVTRGPGGLGLNPYLCKRASVIIIASKISLYPEEKYEQGLALVTCSTRRPSSAALSPAVKSLNYLNNIMAKVEAIAAGCEEGVLLNDQGFISECTGDNLFVVKNSRISTPPGSAGILYGITRQVVIEMAIEAGYEMQESDLTRYDVYTADECFLTGTAAEVVPAVIYDQRRIGDGVPGPVTRDLTTRFHELTKNSGTPIYSGSAAV